eukprot:TRINITY_DN14875_c0_g2_i2.p1 TRINITY_DN14875_c0_g2~~TRINITY_DN14875_c0_g2_i2.p1  ORF type:complete len:1295 (-),score=285.21 TRINITY_DN14875_c0_g2_i2:476-4360(-)
MATAQAKALPEACQGYVRQPTIARETVVFVAEDDLWSCTLEGDSSSSSSCSPHRLTSSRRASHPVFSNEGDLIAFTVKSDIWVLNLSTGEQKRLTWLGWGDARPVAWSVHDGQRHVVFSTTYGDAFFRPTLRRVGLQGSGSTEVLFAGSELDAATYGVGPDSSGLMLGRHTADLVANGGWKGYAGGRYGHLWLDVGGTGKFTALELRPDNAAECAHLSLYCPMWLAEQQRIWFIADHDGSGNLWSVDVEGAGLTKHTMHDTFDARSARSDGQNIVYTYAGELWVLQAGCEARRVGLNFGSTTSHLSRYLDAGDWVETVVLHPKGTHCGVMCRGQVFEMALWEGPAVCLRPPPLDAEAMKGGLRRAVRCLHLDYLYSGRLFTLTDEHAPLASFTIHPAPCMPHEDASEKAREWLQLFMADTGASAIQMTTEKSIGSPVEMACSPVHDAVLLTTKRNELLLLEFVPEGGSAKPNPQKDPLARTDVPLHIEVSVLDSSDHDEGMSAPCWSPDGEWVAYVRRDAEYGASIVLLCLATGDKHVVADSSFENDNPSFDPSGRYLAFFSARTFTPVEDGVLPDYSFAAGAQQPYLLLLQKDASNPFQTIPESPATTAARRNGDSCEDDEEEGDDEDEDAEDDDEAQDEDAYEPPEKIVIDLEGIETRILKFPVSLGGYSNGEWNSDGNFQYLRHLKAKVTEKELHVSEDPEDCEVYALMMYNFSTQKEMQLADKVLDSFLSMNLENMCLQIEGEDDVEEYRVHVAGKKCPQDDDDGDEEADLDNPGYESGVLDFTNRISLEVVPQEEWAQVFDDICHHVAENFLDTSINESGRWPLVCSKYRELLPRLRSRDDLNDLCTELLAELGVSHIAVGGPEWVEGSSALNGQQGYLGVETSWVDLPGGGAYRVDSLAVGDVWDDKYSGPLARPCVDVTVGSLIVAINRLRVTEEMSVERMITNFGDCDIFVTVVPPENIEAFQKVQELLVKSGGADGFRRMNATQQKSLKARAPGGKKGKQKGKKAEEPAKAAAALQAEIDKHLEDALAKAGVDISEGPSWKTVRVSCVSETVACNALFRDLVERRAAAVHAASKGRVGYLHVPDTSELGFAEFYRYYTKECARDALIVDLRCNTGGYVAELLLKKLREVPIGWTVRRPGRGKPNLLPGLCPSGQLVLLIDENTCSDGEYWAEAFQRMKLGKVVGQRTWGGVVEVGTADLELLGGGELQIPGAHVFMLGPIGYGLENLGATPDIPVAWPPGVPAEEDPQLAEATRQALAMVNSAEARPIVPAMPNTRLGRPVARRS